MGLFDKKFCDICGDKIGLLGNRKLEDGNMCKDCSKKLSPFFSDRRRSTVDEIKQQLLYREQNRQYLKSFSPDRVFGDDKKFFIDSSKGAFVISGRGQNNWDEENPDIISVSSVNSCNLRIDQDEEEQYYENANGESVSFNPPRYLYTYTFVLEFNVNNPYFDDFEVTLNNREVEMNTPEYMNLQQLALNIMSSVAPGKFTMPQMNNVCQNNMGYYPMQGNVYQGNMPCFNQAQTNPFMQAANIGQQFNNGYNPYQTSTPPVQQPAQGMYGNQPVGYPQQQTAFQQNGFNQQPVFNSGNWFCPACGTANTGNFCCNCGNKKA